MQGLVLHGFLPFKDLPSEGEHTDSELPIKKKIVIKKTIKITKKNTNSSSLRKLQCNKKVLLYSLLSKLSRCYVAL